MWTLHLLASRGRTHEDTDGNPAGGTPKRRRVVLPLDVKGKWKEAPLSTSSDAVDLAQSDAAREPEASSAQGRVGPWGFTTDQVDRYPALKKRNFWCIQRHSATAMHYDLRMQVDGGTVSWAVPKGLIGISKHGESSRMAVETTIHPIRYTTYEGADGRDFSAGRKGGTLLWDIGEYVITRPSYEDDSSDERATQRKKRRYGSPGKPESDDSDGKYQEDLFRQALYRPNSYGKSRSIHFVLRGGRKMTDHSFILILAASSKTSTLSSNGKVKKTWFLRLPRGVDEHLWDRGGEEGDFWGKSVKTGRSLNEVCAGSKARPERWESEKERYKDWFGDGD